MDHEYDDDRPTDRAGEVDHGDQAPFGASAAEYAFDSLKAPIRRVTVPDVAIPYAPALEKAVLPDENDVLRALRQVMRREVAA